MNPTICICSPLCCTVEYLERKISEGSAKVAEKNFFSKVKRRKISTD
jgi:hypothetical protein